jgi:hypothetical protein
MLKTVSARAKDILQSHGALPKGGQYGQQVDARSRRLAARLQGGQLPYDERQDLFRDSWTGSSGIVSSSSGPASS